MATNRTYRVLYIGLTNDLKRRMKEHRFKEYPKAFTAKYNISKLFYFEEYESTDKAREREVQMKQNSREKKLTLIEGQNPEWIDLTHELRET